jgi:DNA-directed RNA polymerase specialized sigma24 family protein
MKKQISKSGTGTNSAAADLATLKDQIKRGSLKEAHDALNSVLNIISGMNPDASYIGVIRAFNKQIPARISSERQREIVNALKDQDATISDRALFVATYLFVGTVLKGIEPSLRVSEDKNSSMLINTMVSVNNSLKSRNIKAENLRTTIYHVAKNNSRAYRSRTFSSRQIHQNYNGRKKVLVSNDNPFDKLLRRNLQDELDLIMNMLTPKREKTIELKFGLRGNYEHTTAEIAKIFDMPTASSKRLVSQALRDLRRPSRSKRLIEYVH